MIFTLANLFPENCCISKTMEEHQVVVTEASQKGIWTHGYLYGNRSRYVFSTYYRLGFRLLGLSCVLVQTHHLHRPKAHLRSLCCFKAFAKAEKSECYFNSSKVEAGQWVTGHRHHFPQKSKQRGSHAWKWLTFRMVTLQTSSIKWCQIAEKIGHNFAPHSCRCSLPLFFLQRGSKFLSSPAPTVPPKTL